MRTYASMQALIQELEGDAAEITRILERNRTAVARIEQGANDPVDWGALGFTGNYAAGLRRENERERETIAREATRAREEAGRLASQIGAADASVRSIYLFGSLASGDPRSRDFDIDLATGRRLYSRD